MADTKIRFRSPFKFYFANTLKIFIYCFFEFSLAVINLQGQKALYVVELKALSQAIGQNVTYAFFVCQFKDFHGKRQL